MAEVDGDGRRQNRRRLHLLVAAVIHRLRSDRDRLESARKSVCSFVVEGMSRDEEVMGSYPVMCKTFSLSSMVSLKP